MNESGIGIDVDRDVNLHAVRRGARKRIVAAGARETPRGHRSNCRTHAFFAVVEPFTHVGRESFPADFSAKRQNLALANTRSAKRREIVTPPLLGHANAHLAHPYNVHL